MQRAEGKGIEPSGLSPRPGVQNPFAAFALPSIRRSPESNRIQKLCRQPPNQSATAPYAESSSSNAGRTMRAARVFGRHRLSEDTKRMVRDSNPGTPHKRRYSVSNRAHSTALPTILKWRDKDSNLGTRGNWFTASRVCPLRYLSDSKKHITALRQMLCGTLL